MHKKPKLSTILLALFGAAMVIDDCNAYTLNGAYALNGGTATFSNQTYLSGNTDVSAIFVTNAGNLILYNPTITKTGDSSDPLTSNSPQDCFVTAFYIIFGGRYFD
jgi:hypothetical protein